MKTTESKCKVLLLSRCLIALVLSVFMQYLLLAAFLLFINFNALHPMRWLKESSSLIFSFYTWVVITPLIASIFIYAILLGKSHLAIKRYYASRFVWLVKTFPRKLSFLGIHIVVGLLTACTYTKFLHEDYRSLTYECYGQRCLNPYYTFLTGIGISSGGYHFWKANLKQEPEAVFPNIQQASVVRLRSLHSILYKSLVKSFMPCLYYTFIYWLVGHYGNERFALLFGMDLEENYFSFFSCVTNLRLLFYAWILSSQILSNMHLMQKLFSIFLTQEIEFVIEKAQLACPSLDIKADKDVTLVEALATIQVPIIQKLGALQVQTMGNSSRISKRTAIYNLSIPGGYPTNWNDLSAQCLAIMNEFIEDLAQSIRNISTLKNAEFICKAQTSATLEAEKILLRQYNVMYGIRRMVPDASASAVTTLTCPKAPPTAQRIKEYFDNKYKQLQTTLHAAFRSIPGFFYMFCEAEGAKTAFVLSNAQIIVWISQGLAGICASSFKEDKHGIVQVTLPEIINTLLRLKQESDKLNNVNLNGKKWDRNLIALKSGVKRSLYKIATVYGDYLPDIIEDAQNLRILTSFKNYQDT
uniref:Nucleoporin Ndc1 n=1 Tax=Glossina morsitans morsitans TaxID=37546 RepID=A0A1B0FH91_GLOMM